MRRMLKQAAAMRGGRKRVEPPREGHGGKLRLRFKLLTSNFGAGGSGVELSRLSPSVYPPMYSVVYCMAYGV